jgi:hypothetical protein
MWKRPSTLLAWLAGVITAVVLLAIAYVIGSGEFSLFGRGGTAGIFTFVLREVPILRPFSRNVQTSNLLERFHLFQTDMPGMLLLLFAVLVMRLAYKLRQRQLRRRGTRLLVVSTQSQRFFLWCGVVCTFSWLLMEGSRPYYLFHIAPLLLIGCVIALELWNEVFASRWFGEWGALLVMIAAIALGMSHAIPSAVLGEAIARDRQAAISRFLREATIDSSRKSRILFDVAGLDRALTDTSRGVLTLDMFQPPANAEALIQKLHSNRMDYVVLRSSPVGSAFEPGRMLLPRVLVSIGEVRDSALGFFYDDGRSYDVSLIRLIDEGLDTLRLYRIQPSNCSNSDGSVVGN